MRRKTERLTFRLDKSTFNRIQELAQKREDNLSRVLTILIKKGFEEIDKNELNLPNR